MDMSNLMGARQTIVATPIPPELFERLLARYEQGPLPTLHHCYFTLLYPMFGKPFAIPDFVVPIRVPDDWINRAGQLETVWDYAQARMFQGQHLAPLRKGRFHRWLQNRFISGVSFNVGYAASEPHATLEAPWLVKGEMPDFGYGYTPEEALEKFL